MNKSRREAGIAGWTDGRLALLVYGFPAAVTLLAVALWAIVPAPWGGYLFSILVGYLGIVLIVHASYASSASYELTRRFVKGTMMRVNGMSNTEAEDKADEFGFGLVSCEVAAWVFRAAGLTLLVFAAIRLYWQA